MRIIHARKRVFDDDHAFKNNFTLLVWILSILKWKEYGNQVVLYTDKITLDKIKEFGFDNLYDEINSSYLEDEEVCKGIDFYCYWAMPKILALKHELLDLGNKAVVSDQDVVPMSNLSRMWTNSDIAVWSNKEFVEFKQIYPNKSELSLPKGYELPKWFSGIAKPLNTGILYFKHKEVFEIFLKEVLNMSIDNHNNHKNTNCQTMCNVEQRMLGELVRYKKLSYSVIQPINQGLFNRNGFHTHGYKSLIDNPDKINTINEIDFNCCLLELIRNSKAEVYYNLINMPMFKEEKEMLYSGNYNIVKELAIYF